MSDKDFGKWMQPASLLRTWNSMRMPFASMLPAGWTCDEIVVTMAQTGFQRRTSLLRKPQWVHSKEARMICLKNGTRNSIRRVVPWVMIACDDQRQKSHATQQTCSSQLTQSDSMMSGMWSSSPMSRYTDSLGAAASASTCNDALAM